MVNSEKVDEKNLRSKLLGADRERVEADVKRREIQQDVSRLKIKKKGDGWG
jgi:hypothetical protein